MKTFRHLTLILLFGGLISLEVWHGFSRLSALAERGRAEALEEIRRRQSDLARDFSEKLRAERDHARYLARAPAVRELLRSKSGSAEAARGRDRCERDLAPYLLSFPIIDSFSLYATGGEERLKLMRILLHSPWPEPGSSTPGGVGSLPEPRLGRQPEQVRSFLEAISKAGLDEVMLSDLENDPVRIEFPEGDRQVLRYAARVREGEETLGLVSLTLRAAPLLDAVRSWRPAAGAKSLLITGDGRFLAHPDRRRDQPGAVTFAQECPEAAAGILAGRLEVREGDRLFLAQPLTDGLPGWRLVAEVPDSAFELALSSLQGEYSWVIASMAGTALLLVLAGWFLLRLSIREVRLAESGRYLERVRRESARYRALMEGAADMILIVDPERGMIREANAAARRALGLPEGECALRDVLVPGELPRFEERLRETLAGGVADLGEISVRGGLSSGPGKMLPASCRLAAIDLGEERVVEVSLRDLSKEKDMERQVRISERLGSLGLLTAGVAHEINNPLEGIENYLTLLDREGADAGRRARYLEMVRYGFRRIRDIVRDLSSFSRPQVKGTTADLAQVADRALEMVRYDRAFRTVEVERRGMDRPLLVVGDAGRLEQVFLNLLLNAARAMQSQGMITISACEAGEAEGDRRVEARIEDTGPGIPSEVLSRIFDPFFSTGEGTGLGLSIAYGIVRAHGGELRAANRPEGGACFTLSLPAATGLREPAASLAHRSTQ